MSRERAARSGREPDERFRRVPPPRPRLGLNRERRRRAAIRSNTLGTEWGAGSRTCAAGTFPTPWPPPAARPSCSSREKKRNARFEARRYGDANSRGVFLLFVRKANEPRSGFHILSSR